MNKYTNVYCAIILLIFTINSLPVFGIEEGELAPNFKNRTINNELFDLHSYKGKLVLLNFWASWSSPCRNEIHYLIQTHQRFNNDFFAIVSVNVDEPTSKVKTFVERNNMDWVQTKNMNGIVSEIYSVNIIPASFLISPDGFILARGDVLQGEKIIPTIEPYLKKYFPSQKVIIERKQIPPTPIPASNKVMVSQPTKTFASPTPTYKIENITNSAYANTEKKIENSELDKPINIPINKTPSILKEIIVFTMLTVGIICSAFAHIWILVIAWKESPVWAVLIFLFPLVLLIFLFLYFQDVKSPFILLLVSVCLLIISSCI